MNSNINLVVCPQCGNGDKDKVKYFPGVGYKCKYCGKEISNQELEEQSRFRNGMDVMFRFMKVKDYQSAKYHIQELLRSHPENQKLQECYMECLTNNFEDMFWRNEENYDREEAIKCMESIFEICQQDHTALSKKITKYSKTRQQICRNILNKVQHKMIRCAVVAVLAMLGMMFHIFIISNVYATFIFGFVIAINLYSLLGLGPIEYYIYAKKLDRLMLMPEEKMYPFYSVMDDIYDMYCEL